MKKHQVVENDGTEGDIAPSLSENKNIPEKSRDTDKKKPQKKLSKRTIWTIKITVVTFVLAMFISFLTEITASNSNIIISAILLLLLIVVSIVFDAVGVAATSCELAPLLSMAARRIRGAKIAVKLVKNAEKVSNICNDVIGDMCGIISGTCAAAIVIQLSVNNPGTLLPNILMSSVIAAITVGGKAFFKEIAIKNSREMIMFASRVLGLFYKPKK